MGVACWDARLSRTLQTKISTTNSAEHAPSTQ